MDNDLGKDMVNELDFVSVYKMMFIYNAIQKGWTVKKIIKNFYCDDFLKKFIESNMNFTSLLGVS